MYNIVKTISYEVLVLGIVMMNSKIHLLALIEIE